MAGSIYPAACPTGSYCTYPASVTTCPSGTYNSLQNRTLLSQCVYCPAGSYCLQGSVNYTQCAPGTYNSLIKATAVSACLSSPAGSFSLSDASIFTNCSAGTFGALPGATACSNCSTGTTQPFKVQLTCIQCAIGKYMSSMDPREFESLLSRFSVSPLLVPKNENVCSRPLTHRFFLFVASDFITLSKHFTGSISCIYLRVSDFAIWFFILNCNSLAESIH